MNFSKIYSAFPKAMNSEVQAVISLLASDMERPNSIHENGQDVLLNGERISIPIRVYFKGFDTDKINTLSDTGKVILFCIYLRHHDGYIRQKALSSLISENQYFIIPYIFQLLGEYVIEILVDLDRLISETNIDLFRHFMSENPDYSNLTKSRMISYWNEYYRFGENKDIENYIGTRIFKRLQNG